jgi:hypothetical protein
MIKKIVWSITAIFLAALGYVFFNIAPVIALPVLPTKWADCVVNSTVKRFVDSGTFPDLLLDVLSSNPELVTANTFDAISEMYVTAQDGQVKKMQTLILKVNSKKLFCHKIPNSKLNDSGIPTDYAGQRVAEAIGQPWKCKD